MIAVATRTTVEMLRFQPQSLRADAMLSGLERAASSAGVEVVPTTSYRGGASLLLLWGPGAPNRFGPMREHLAAGGHVVCLDLPYWQRETKARISIDAAHPQRWVMRRDWPVSRFRGDGVAVSDVWNPDGPVIVAGLGRKARVQYGESVVLGWEAEMLRACAERWPSRRVLYRRKQADAPVPAGAPLASDRPIEDVLAGASLLVTWHSNVAIDAIRLGIPVVCKDGAAAAVCPSVLGLDNPRPLDAAVRAKFLANLAWFQWAPSEAVSMWHFIGEVLACA